MLRESSLGTGSEVDLHQVVQTRLSTAMSGASNSEAGNSETGVTHGNELLRFVDAVLLYPEDLVAARIALLNILSPEAFVDTCATVASFNAVVKVADGTGIPLETAKHDKTADLRKALRIDQLRDHGRFQPD